MLPPDGAAARFTHESARAETPGKATPRVVTRDDLLPLCPHCSVELSEIVARAVESHPAGSSEVVYFCPHCRRLLGIRPGPAR